MFKKLLRSTNAVNFNNILVNAMFHYNNYFLIIERYFLIIILSRNKSEGLGFQNYSKVEISKIIE